MKKHLYKYIIIFILVLVFTVSFNGSHSIQSVDDLAYAVALGIDVGETSNLKVTFQFTKPSSSGGEGSSGGEEVSSVVDSVEANSIDSAINLINSFISKELNLSHCKIVVFSEEIAKRGLDAEVYSLVNKVQMRPDTNVIISTCSANEYIKNVTPSLENLVAKFYEILPRTSEYTGSTSNVQLGHFFNQMVCNTCEPVAILRKRHS